MLFTTVAPTPAAGHPQPSGKCCVKQSWTDSASDLLSDHIKHSRGQAITQAKDIANKKQPAGLSRPHSYRAPLTLARLTVLPCSSLSNISPSHHVSLHNSLFCQVTSSMRPHSSPLTLLGQCHHTGDHSLVLLGPVPQLAVDTPPCNQDPRHHDAVLHEQAATLVMALWS